MMPILFAENETSFTTNGIGRLADATKCEVTEERNGQYELVMQYPIEGELFGEIVCGRYIYTTHDESKVPQAFKIYRISAPLEGVITINAWHISYALNTIIVSPFTASNCSAALTGIKNNSMNTNPFTFWTDKSVNATFTLSVPTSARACLGGVRGSVLDVYGKGEYEFDMFTVKLHVNRGTNRDVTIRYGKNLTRLDQALDASNVYNSVVPYWTDGETVVSGGVITKAGQTPGATIALDLSRDFDDAPTVQELEAKAQTHVDTTDNYILKENVKVDFVALWQTEEYKDYAALERVFLCDTVNVFYAKLGVNITAKVIKVVYDSLLERYTSIELGEPSTSLIQQIKTDIAADVLQNVPSTGMMQAAIDKATELINGGFGGYIKFKYLSDGTPSEMLVMDSPSEATAVNIIRLNKNGLGFSTDGGATYANAWTIDGNLVADFITSGTLSAIDISGVNISGSNITGNTISGGTISGSTVSGNTITGGTISGTTITGSTLTSATSNGSVQIANGNINFFKNATTTGAPFSQIKHTVDSSQGDSIEWTNSGYTKLVNTGGGQWTADFLQFAIHANAPVLQFQIYPDADGYHARFLTDFVELNSNVSLKTASGSNAEVRRYQILDYSGTLAGEMLMTLSTAQDGNKYPRRFRWRQFGLNASTYERQDFCETFQLPAGGLNLTASADYDILTTKTANISLWSGTLGTTGTQIGTNAYSTHSAFVVQGRPSGANRGKTTITIPKALVSSSEPTGNNITDYWSMADENNYVNFCVWYSGNNLYMKKISGTGVIQSVYGLI